MGQCPGEDIFTFKCLEQLGVEASDIGEASMLWKSADS